GTGVDGEDTHPIEVITPEGGLKGKWDATRLEQLLTNLISNATRYSPEGTPIKVRITSEGDQARVEVADCGPGVAPGERERLFDRYYQTVPLEGIDPD